MSFEVVVKRGPLPPSWREQVMRGWGQYDPRLLDPHEWASEFELGPEGPAVHVLVVRDGRQVVGHHSAIPLKFRIGDREEHVIGKGEAIYVDRAGVERGARVEWDGRRLRLVEALASGLFERLGEFGLAAYVGYAQPHSERRLVQAGCSVVTAPHRRFFFFHDAGEALRRSAVPTPLRAAARLALGGQRLLRGVRRRPTAVGDVREVESFDPRDDAVLRDGLEPNVLSLDPSAARLNWRFAGHGYKLLTLGTPVWGYVVLSPLEPSGRRRVVDWLVPASRAEEVPAIANSLIAAGADAAALEWVVPTTSAGGRLLAVSLARSRLLSHPRRGEHRMVVYGDSPFTNADRWSLTLATHERF